VAKLVRDRVTLVRPTVFRTSGGWDYDRVLDGLGAALGDAGVSRAAFVGHSFGGGIAMGYAARHPEQVARLVLVDSIGLSGRWDLAKEALVGTRVDRLATIGAARDFIGAWRHSPRSVARAAWWAYSVDKTEEIAAIIKAGVATDVLWAADDTLLGADWGHRFALSVDAGYTVVDSAAGPLDHSWVFRRPDLFVDILDRLGVTTAGGPAGMAAAGGAGAARRNGR
jgi:pimeloyl-ACP methyl ester carboxylesterase